jgi:hypothetical protein
MGTERTLLGESNNDFLDLNASQAKQESGVHAQGQVDMNAVVQKGRPLSARLT